MPGPIAKRSSERRRRNIVPGETVIQRSEPVKIPGCPKDAHPIARRWYNAVKQSGQSEYFEPSDWAAALYVVEAITRNLEGERFSAQLFGTIWAAMEDLLTTEQARRRARIEVERGLEEEQAGPTALDAYRKMVTG